MKSAILLTWIVLLANATALITIALKIDGLKGDLQLYTSGLSECDRNVKNWIDVGIEVHEDIRRDIESLKDSTERGFEVQQESIHSDALFSQDTREKVFDLIERVERLESVVNQR